MPPVGFEPTISAGERPQIYALDHVVVVYVYLHEFLTSALEGGHLYPAVPLFLVSVEQVVSWAE